MAESHEPAERPAVSIIIPVWNKVDYTQLCLEALIETTPDGLYEVVIVDNASTDATPELLGSLTGPVQVVRNEENVGFTLACNQGAKVARGHYLLFLNNDTTPCPGWLEALLDLAESDPTIGAVVAKLIYPDGRLQEAGGLVFSDGSGWNFGRLDDPAKPAYGRVQDVDYGSGACLLVRAELFERLGGFDERYAPAYYEDTDLCFAIRDLGFRVVYCPDSVVVHFEGVTAGTDLGSGMKRFQAINREKFCAKWAEALKRQDAPPDRTGRAPTTASRERLGPPPAAAPAPAAAPRPALRVERTDRGLVLVPADDARPRRAAPSRPGAPKVLVVDALLPLFDRCSGGLRMLRLLELLQRCGAEVTFTAQNANGQARYVDELTRRGIRVFATEQGVVEATTPGVAAAAIDLRRALDADRYDIVILSFWYVAKNYLPIIRREQPHAKVLVDSVDVHYVRELREAELAEPADRERRAAEALARKANELEVYRAADGVIAVTENDRSALVADGIDVPILCVPNIHEVRAHDVSPSGRKDLVFVGGFGHPPNRDSARFIAHEIAPRLRERLPGVRTYLVGSHPTPEVQALAEDDIIVTGFVPSVSPYLDACRVFIAPLRYGAGMKGKIGEAMAHAVPVVTTSVGAEGMGLVHGMHCLIADDPGAFVDAIARLHADDALWMRLAEGGRARIRATLSEDVVLEKVRAVVERFGPARAASPQGAPAPAAPAPTRGPAAAPKRPAVRVEIR